MAELTWPGRVSRARATQIMDLLMLAPEIQEELLFGRVEIRGERKIPGPRAQLLIEPARR